MTEPDETSDWLAVYARVGAAMFPGSSQVKSMRPSMSAHSINEDIGDGAGRGFPTSFIYATVHHTDFDPEWPIKPDWPYVVRGLRRSLAASQADFAAMCSLGRATVERWEAGTAAPFRGDALQLLSLVKPHLETPVQAGQGLNLAAAAVLPRLTQPTARHTGQQLVNMLKSDKHDHRDLGRGLLGALVTAGIVVAVDPSVGPLEGTYVLLAGQASAAVEQPTWMIQLGNDVGLLSKADRQFVLSLASRLARR